MTGLRRLASTLGDRYLIERELGAGGMAKVYLARDLKHDREVALKILPPELHTATGAERFLNEIRITSSLDHPNILTLIDSGSTDGSLWYVVPYIRGESLRERLKREGALPLDDAINIARQVASALEFAHARGIVHRDVKPENILLHEGVALLADFGVALAVAEAGGDRLTGTGHSVGTPHYMSPEQATHDRHLDLRTDIYSLGAVLYEMLAGEPPHTGPNAQAVIARLLTERPTPLRLLRDTVPEPVEAAVARALAKVPADRFPRAAHFADALTARQAMPGWPTSRIRRAAGLTLLIALGALGAFGLSRLLRKPAAPPLPPEIIQLTSSGRATSPIFSPDGSQVAYAIRDCDTAGLCRQRLLVREVAENTERAIVEGVIGTLRVWGWSPNGLRILYAVYHSEGVTAYLVPRLGGTPTRLGPYTAGGFAGTDDTLYLHPYQTAWVGRMDVVSAATGEVADTIPLPSTIGPGSQFTISSDGWRLAATTRIPNKRTRLELVDRRGNAVADTLEGSYWAPRWDPASRGLVAASAGSSADHTRLVLFPVDARTGRVAEAEPRVLADLETGPQTLFYDLSRRGSGVVYMRSREGNYTVWAIGRRTTEGPFNRLHRIETSTQVFTGYLSGDGRTVFTLRRIATSASAEEDPPVQWFVQPFDGNAPRPMTPILSGMSDFSIPVDGRRLLFASTVGDHARLDWYDAATAERTPFAEVPATRLTTWILADGVAWAPPALDTIHVLDAAGRVRKEIALPDSVLPAFPLPGSPDRTEIALIRVGSRQEPRPWGLYRVSVKTGSVRLVTRMARFGDFNGVSWTSDGWIHMHMRAFGTLLPNLYRVRASGGDFEREPPLPFEANQAPFSLSIDGLRGVVTETSYQTDLMLAQLHNPIRNRTSH